jgi:hypothetical protein
MQQLRSKEKSQRVKSHKSKRRKSLLPSHSSSTIHTILYPPPTRFIRSASKQFAFLRVLSIEIRLNYVSVLKWNSIFQTRIQWGIPLSKRNLPHHIYHRLYHFYLHFHYFTKLLKLLLYFSILTSTCCKYGSTPFY